MVTRQTIIVRRAKIEEIDTISAIYNEHVDSGISTFDEFHITNERYLMFFSPEMRKSFILVAELEGQITGWTSVEPISDRWAYRFTCISSTYIRQEFTGKKIGHELSLAKFSEASKLGYHSIIAETLSTNPKSVAFLMSLGYKVIGEIIDAGFRDDKWIGLVILQKILNS